VVAELVQEHLVKVEVAAELVVIENLQEQLMVVIPYLLEELLLLQQ
tara:strand:+ start:100 stop:237 length:138 start_codon:yes stop_codon:yes gene_type:complete